MTTAFTYLLQKTPHVPGSPTGGYYQFASGEGDIHQRGVFGNGESGGQGDQEKARQIRLKGVWHEEELEIGNDNTGNSFLNINRTIQWKYH